MATYTSHYNLKKPATSDKIRIADFNGNADTIDATMYDNATLGAQLKADIGIVENTNTATHNISAGQYVIWKGDLYTASSAISSGATLSSANLTAVSGGGLNALNGILSNLGNLHCNHYWNTTTITIDIGFAPTTGKQATGILVSGNQQVLALLDLSNAPAVYVINGSKTFTISLSGSVFTITASGTLWGPSMVLWTNV